MARRPPVRRNQRPRGSFRCTRLVEATLLPRWPPRERGLTSFAALLHVRPDELLGVLLEHLVDLVQDRIDVVGELVLPLLGAPRSLTLSAGVLCCRHAETSVIRGSRPAVSTLSSPTRGLPNHAIWHWYRTGIWSLMFREPAVVRGLSPGT